MRKVPRGTNLGLLYLLWTMLSGRLLLSRGAVFGALEDFGLDEKAVRRSATALSEGRWEIPPMLEAFQEVVEEEGKWEAHRDGRYRVVAVDLVGFYRPKLQEGPDKHYCSEAGKALPAICLGMVVSVGSVGSQRVPLLRAMARTPTEAEIPPSETPPSATQQEQARQGDQSQQDQSQQDQSQQDQSQQDQSQREEAPQKKGSETALKLAVLKQTAGLLADDEAVTADAGIGLAMVQEAGIKCYVIRCGKNFTARRASLPAYKGRGARPPRGELVRPLPRTHKGKTLAATAPDRQEAWRVDMPDGKSQLILRAEFWDELVLSDAKPGAPVFGCVAIYDPRYKEPLLLAMAPGWTGPEARAFYSDRWAIEQVPLSAKQMIGASRAFVSGKESRQRLPELSLLAGNLLSYVAATAPPIKTGFWDREPRATPGRVRRVLGRVNAEKLGDLPEPFRKKQSVTEHFPKGIAAHRRTKRVSQDSIPGPALQKAA